MNKELHDYKRQLILECASKHFSELGYENASIGKIARELHIGVGTIYSFFGSKENLFAEHNYMILSRIHATVKSEIECIKEPMKKLESFIRHKMGYFEKNRKILNDYICYR